MPKLSAYYIILSSLFVTSLSTTITTIHITFAQTTPTGLEICLIHNCKEMNLKVLSKDMKPREIQ